MRDGDEAYASRENGAETMSRQTRPSGAQGGRGERDENAEDEVERGAIAEEGGAPVS